MKDNRTGKSPRTASLQPQAPQPGRNLAPLDLQSLHNTISQTVQGQPSKSESLPAPIPSEQIGLAPAPDRFAEIQSQGATETVIAQATLTMEQPAVSLVPPLFERSITQIPATPKLRLVHSSKASTPPQVKAAAPAVIEPPELVEDDVAVPSPEIPDEYIVNDQGVLWLKTDKTGAVVEHWLSSRIDVVALARSPDSTSWGTLISFLDLDNVTHRWCIPNKMFASGTSAIISTLQDQGAQVAQPAIRRQELMRYIQGCQPAERLLAATQAGWNGSVFVMPDGSSYGPSAEPVEFMSGNPADSQAYTHAGTLNDWKAHNAAICVGNSRLVLAMCVPFIGPVLKLLGEESGGFHLVGDTSTGKTTTLLVACSVWGQPGALKGSWRATDNGLEGTAAMRNDMFLGLDELGQSSPDQVGNIVYMVFNGQGKARANSYGVKRPSTTWRLPVLSTGECTVTEHMASGGKRTMAGQEVRLANIPADTGCDLGIFENLHGQANGAELSLFVAESCRKHFGTAGREWVRQLADPDMQAGILEGIRAAIAEFEAAYIPADASGQVRRVGRRFALAAAVGEACVASDILPWPPGEATDGVRKCFEAWLAPQVDTQVQAEEQGIAQVRRYLLEHGAEHFADVDGGDPERSGIRPLYGYRKRLADGRWDYFVLSRVFTEVICSGLNARLVTKALVRERYLIPESGPGGKNQVSRNFFGMQLRVNHISADLLGPPAAAEASSGSQLH